MGDECLLVVEHAVVTDEEEDPLEAELSRAPDDYVSVGFNHNNNNENRCIRNPDGEPAATNAAAAAAGDVIINRQGSSVVQATFNFINCIVGAGAIGLGGAIADSGGLISIVSVILFAYLVKLSLDLVIETSLRHGCSSFEDLGDAAFGPFGRKLVMTAKFSYSFGCLVAYTVVVKDNLGPALSNILPRLCSPLDHIPGIVTWCVSTVIILPLCMLKDMTPLAGASIVSIGCMVSIIAIVAWLWFVGQKLPDDADASTKYNAGQELYKHWFVVHTKAYLNNVGTFLFAFVCHHTVHLVFNSLRPEIRTLRTWKTVSAWSLSTSCLITLAVGILVYMTFWEKTQSDIFQVYPPTLVLDLAKLFLCISMLLTFPLPFFTCRELFAWILFSKSEVTGRSMEHLGHDRGLEEPLLRTEVMVDGQSEERIGYVSLAEAAGIPANQSELSAIHDDRSVDQSDDSSGVFPWGQHVGLTVGIWFVATALGVGAPNLGDVLALVGCLCGTLIAFILPAAADIKLSGWRPLNLAILSIGLVIGTLGTFCSMKKFIVDI